MWPDHLSKKSWRRSHNEPVFSGRIREHIADFKVVEVFDLEFTNEGEHLYIQVEKSDMTTPQAARIFAEHFGVPEYDISYSGMKDKRAIATQWFSVRLPRTKTSPIVPSMRILQERWHARKLRRGQHQANRFEIIIRGLKSKLGADFHSRLQSPFPNYFGPQRFGYQGGNWNRAEQWVAELRPRIGRATRAIYLSTLRAGVFNDLLALRVENGTWNTLIDGDVSLLGLPSGPMWGRGSLPTSNRAQRYEDRIRRLHPQVCDALEWVGLKHDRRALAVNPREVDMQLENDSMLVSFVLPPSAYANVFLYEHFDLMECRS